jgi:hypothetical protein
MEIIENEPYTDQWSRPLFLFIAFETLLQCSFFEATFVQSHHRARLPGEIVGSCYLMRNSNNGVLDEVVCIPFVPAKRHISKKLWPHRKKNPSLGSQQFSPIPCPLKHQSFPPHAFGHTLEWI